MKSIKTLTTNLLLLSSLFFTACTRDEAALPDTKDVIIRNSWTVQDIYTGITRVPLADNYGLQFKADGTLNMKNNTGHYTGTWKLVKNVEADVLQVRLTATQPDVLDFSRAWTIEAVSNQNITLKNADSRLLMQRD